MIRKIDNINEFELGIIPDTKDSYFKEEEVYEGEDMIIGNENNLVAIAKEGVFTGNIGKDSNGFRALYSGRLGIPVRTVDEINNINPMIGEILFNSTDSTIEIYDGDVWKTLAFV